MSTFINFDEFPAAVRALLPVGWVPRRGTLGCVQRDFL